MSLLLIEDREVNVADLVLGRLYAVGFAGLLYVMVRDVKETMYFLEEDVIVREAIGKRRRES